MLLTISYKEWISSTAVVGITRSSELKAVDAAIKAYDNEEKFHSKSRLDALCIAIERWTLSKSLEHGGSGYGRLIHSRRNRTKIIQRLVNEIKAISPKSEIWPDRVKFGSMNLDQDGMKNARLGVLYFWQGVNVETTIFSSIVDFGISAIQDTHYAATGGYTAPSGEISSMATSVFDAARETHAERMKQKSANPGEAERSNRNEAMKWFVDFFRRIGEKILAYMKGLIADPLKIIELVKSIAMWACTNFLDKMNPFIANTKALVSGLWKFGTSVIQKIDIAWSGRGVVLRNGAPSDIVDGVKNGMTRSLLEGLYETLRSSAQLALNFLSASASVVVDGLVSVIENAIKLCWRAVELRVLNDFISDARGHWSNYREANSIVNDPPRFSDWLRKYTAAVPVIACVTLGSGICGDKTRFLKMYDSGRLVISGSDFSKGVSYLDKVKLHGSRYMEKSGLEFGSDDKMIKGLLKLAGEHADTHYNSSGKLACFRVMDRIMSG